MRAQISVRIWGIWKPVFYADRATCDAVAARWAQSKPWGPGTRYRVEKLRRRP